MFSSSYPILGHGSSLIVCASILTGYTETLYKVIAQFSGTALLQVICLCLPSDVSYLLVNRETSLVTGKVVNFWPYILGVIGIFMVVTMWAVLVTEGCRKIKLRYYAFKLASSTRL
jgi:preprotein translocase subunit SecY